MKTLIIVIHPKIGESLINKKWVDELQKQPDKYDIHNLYEAYPDEKIDVIREQKLIESYDTIIFQFPFYWFSSPPLFKKWMDEVLTDGWAFGSKSGYKLGGKKIALAITAGIEEKDYDLAGKYKYTLKQLTSPFEVTFNYIRADYRSFFAYYGIEFDTSEEWIEKSVTGYLDFIDSL